MSDQSNKSAQTEFGLTAMRRQVCGWLVAVIIATFAQNVFAQGTVAVGAGGAEAVVMPANGTVQGTLPSNTK